MSHRLRPVEALRLIACLSVAALIGRGIASACMGADCSNTGTMHGNMGTMHGLMHGQMMRSASPVATSAPSASGSDDQAAADQIYSERCTACHGADGSGKGPASTSLKPPPANFHDKKWQQTVSDDTIAKAIVEGGASLGLSNQMMPNPDLEDQPGVVKALVARVRGYGK